MIIIENLKVNLVIICVFFSVESIFQMRRDDFIPAKVYTAHILNNLRPQTMSMECELNKYPNQLGDKSETVSTTVFDRMDQLYEDNDYLDGIVQLFMETDLCGNHIDQLYEDSDYLDGIKQLFMETDLCGECIDHLYEDSDNLGGIEQLFMDTDPYCSTSEKFYKEYDDGDYIRPVSSKCDQRDTVSLGQCDCDEKYSSSTTMEDINLTVHKGSGEGFNENDIIIVCGMYIFQILFQKIFFV